MTIFIQLYKRRGIASSFYGFKMNIYHISPSYLDFLREQDPCIPHTHNFNYNKKKPFVGIVLDINAHKYMAPLSSPKDWMNRTNKRFLYPIKQRDHLIAGIVLKYMFPVIDTVYSRVDFKKQDTNYQSLLRLEYRIISTQKDDISKQAEALYNLKKKNLTRIKTCNFTHLETFYQQYRE